MSESIGLSQRIWTFQFILVMLVSFIGTSVVDALQASLPVFIQQTGGSSLLGGLTVTVFALSAIIPSLVAGALADSWGCRQVMIAGGIIFLVGMLAPLFFPGIAALLGFRIIHGIGFAILSVTSAAGASNILPQSRLGEGLGYFGVGQSLALALGPLAGLWLLDFGAMVMWGAMSTVAMIILCLCLFCHCNRKNQDGSPYVRPKFSLSNIVERRAVLPALMILIFCTGICSMIVFSGQYALSKGYGNAGPFFIIAAAAMLGIRFGSGLFMDKFRTVVILVPTMFCGLLAFLLPAILPCKGMFYVSGLLFGLSFGVIMPLLSALAVKRTPKTRWGAANATYYLCLNLGFGSGALCGGTLIDLLGFEKALLCGTLAAVLPALLGIVFLRGEYAEKPLEHTEG